MKTFAFPGTFAFRRMPFHNRANKSSGTSRRHLCAKTLKDGKTVVQRYVDILTDAGFKAVFGDQRNKDVLIDLLNVMLPPHRKVKDITYQTTEIPSFSLFNKSTRLDLRCKGDDGIAEGRAEEKIRIAKAFKEKGVDASIIASATGLSETQISEL